MYKEQHYEQPGNSLRVAVLGANNGIHLIARNLIF